MTTKLYRLGMIFCLSFMFLQLSVSAKPKSKSKSKKKKAYVEHPEAPKPYGAVPTKHQVRWQRMEYYGFVHFGLNTFTGREWGYGDESPKIFKPTNFDASKIVKTFKDGGMKGMIYTAKHHDGWCAWPTKSTEHNVTKSPWKEGQGDVVKEFAEACRKHRMKFGTYLSPWDRNHAEYGREGYLKSYYKQIQELLTNYGSVFEIWFDGANGGDGYYGGKREKRNIGSAEEYYNFKKIVKMIRKLQPRCIIWGAGSHGDARWGGSEKGHVNYPHWPTLHSRHGSHHGTGYRNGDRWVPAEGDTPINHAGWFWHPGQESRVKPPEELMQVWFDSVGRGANLILNLAANREGQLDEADVKSLLGFKKLRDELYAVDYARKASGKASSIRKSNRNAFGPQNLFDDDLDSYWAVNDSETTPSVEIRLKQTATFDVIRLREQIRLGQRVEGWAVDTREKGEWKEILTGSSIGNQVMLKLEKPVTSNHLRLRITKSAACPTISEFSLLLQPGAEAAPFIERSKTGKVRISSTPGSKIFYTTNGKAPTAKSKIYRKSFAFKNGGIIKARAMKDDKFGRLAVRRFGFSKRYWKLLAGDKEKAALVFDNDPNTFWRSDENKALVIHLSKNLLTIKALSYLPRQDGNVVDMTKGCLIEFSEDGEKWQKASEGEFGNLRANPVEQTIVFKKKVKARYLRFTAKEAVEGTGASIAEITLHK